MTLPSMIERSKLYWAARQLIKALGNKIRQPGRHLYHKEPSRNIAKAIDKLEGAMAPWAATDSYIQEMGHRRTALGTAQYIRIARYDQEPMGWEELWHRFSTSYPGHWALQTFPPEELLVNSANIYHLFVFESEPAGLTINRQW